MPITEIKINLFNYFKILFQILVGKIKNVFQKKINPELSLLRCLIQVLLDYLKLFNTKICLNLPSACRREGDRFESRLKTASQTKTLKMVPTAALLDNKDKGCASKGLDVYTVNNALLPNQDAEYVSRCVDNLEPKVTQSPLEIIINMYVLCQFESSSTITNNKTHQLLYFLQNHYLFLLMCFL